MEVLIKTIEKKIAKNNKAYWLVETDQGKMSIWDGALASDVEKFCKGKRCEVETEVNLMKGK